MSEVYSPAYVSRRLVQVEEFLRRLHYTPGTVFRAYSGLGDVSVRIVMKKPESDLPETFVLVPVALEKFVPDYPLDDEFLLYFVKDMVRQMELHEIDEWLRLDGKRVTEPHPKGSV